MSGSALKVKLSSCMDISKPVRWVTWMEMGTCGRRGGYYKPGLEGSEISYDPFGKDYMQDNGAISTMLMVTVMDVIAGKFTLSQVLWFENPGASKLVSGEPWKQHVLVETGYKHNEIIFFRDMNGDGT